MNNILQAFGESIDWVVVALLTIVFVVLIIFLSLFIYFVVKNPKSDDAEKMNLKQNKTQIFLDKQNHISPKRFHERCKVCGSKINRLSGKCSVCGAKNYDDEDNKM